jgi:hypothetical protein
MGQGPRTGGGWDPCPPGPVERQGAWGRGGRQGRGGRGYRNQYYATGLTGWQRAALADATPDETAAAPADRLESIEEKLGQVLARLEDLEAKDSK